MDGRSNRRKKAAFSNLSGAVRMGPNSTLGSNMNIEKCRMTWRCSHACFSCTKLSLIDISEHGARVLLKMLVSC